MYAIRVNVIAADAFVVKRMNVLYEWLKMYYHESIVRDNAFVSTLFGLFVSIFSIQYQNLINFVVIEAEMIYIRQ